MSKNKIIKDIVNVFLSKGLSLFSSILSGFLVPIVLGVSGYGYFKIFTLYSAYTALLHFGFVDGIIMKFAGQDYENLDKKEMRTYSVFFVCFQLIVSLFVMIVSLFIVPDKYRFISIMLAINLFSINVTTYFQFISQATKRFKEYSKRNILLSIAKTSLILFLILIYIIIKKNIPYQIYLLALVIIDALLLVWYFVTYSEIIFGARLPFEYCKIQIKELFSVGILLTLAYQAGHFLFVLDRQFVSMLFPIDVYSVYSFAYNIISMFTTLISSVAIVMFPVLKAMDIKNITSRYKEMLFAISSISSLAMSGYFIIIPIMNNLLVDYVDSLLYLRVIIPAIVINSCISVVGFTYYKILDCNKQYLKYACFGLVIGIVSNSIAYLVFETPLAISWASVITTLIWFYLINQHLEKQYRTNWQPIGIYIVANIVLFYIIVYKIKFWIVGFVLYFIISLFIMVEFNKCTIKLFKLHKK